MGQGPRALCPSRMVAAPAPLCVLTNAEPGPPAPAGRGPTPSSPACPMGPGPWLREASCRWGTFASSGPRARLWKVRAPHMRRWEASRPVSVRSHPERARHVLPGASSCPAGLQPSSPGRSEEALALLGLRRDHARDGCAEGPAGVGQGQGPSAAAPGARGGSGCALTPRLRDLPTP